VIVCAHDEEANLRELIPLLLQQDHPEFEIIIVEDRGNDGTYDYLLAATKAKEQLKMVRVVYLPEHIMGKKFALTLGIKAAKYDWVLLTDADCRPNSNRWLRHMSGCFASDRQIVLGFSAYLKGPGLLNAFIRFETFLTGIQYIAMASLGQPYMGVGRNLAYRKSLFLDNKGFNSHLSLPGGDDDLFVNEHARSRNTTTAIGKEALTYSKPKITWKEFYYQKLRHLSAGKRYKFINKLVLGLFSISWIAVWMLVIPVAFFAPGGGWLAGLIVLRWAVLILLFYDAPRKLGDRFEAWKVPLLDFIYAFYYLVAGLTALVSKKVRWRV
jgi:glycosyltransferase involved in cell wall biosynthesis